MTTPAGFINNRRKFAVVTETVTDGSGTTKKPDTNDSFGYELFTETVTIASTASATPVTILSDARVGAGRKAFIDDCLVSVNGATAWTDASATDVRVRDSNGTPVDFLTFAKAGITNAANLHERSASNVTMGAAFSQNSGGTAGKGLVVVGTTSGTAANFTAGSNLIVTVKGRIQ